MTRPPDSKPGRTIRSVEIAFSIVDELEREGGAGVTELARRLGHSKSTIHSHLRTLSELEYVVRDGERYRLSLRILGTAERVRDQVGNYEVIRAEVDSLAEETGEIVQFGVEEHGKVTYLHKARGERAVETASSVGTQQPIHCTALGKTILAFRSPERTDDIVEAAGFEARAPRTITSAEALREDLGRIEERGYGIDDEENIEGLRCVAAPVRTEAGILGAVSISGPKSRFTDDRIHDELPGFVRRAANVIELNTKFS